MQIENLRFSFVAFNQQSLSLTPTQTTYLELLKKGHTLSQIIKDSFRRGQIISFQDLWNLVVLLAEKSLVLNSEIINFVRTVKVGLKPSGISEVNLSKDAADISPEILRHLPFFRNLNGDIQKLFIEHAQVINVPAHTRLCKAGDTTREMFALIKGSAAVYKNHVEGHRILISKIPEGSIFGEGGFLLGKPRAADVLTLEDSKVLVIHHSPQLIPMIESGKAEVLQKRFWTLYGLLSSEVFSQVPMETLDSLIFSGKMIQLEKGKVITKEGSLGKSFYIIIQGSVDLQQKGFFLRTLEQGQIFGEVALLVSNGTRTATATAKTDCLLLEIEMQEFYDILSQHIVLAKEIEKLAKQRWESRAH